MLWAAGNVLCGEVFGASYSRNLGVLGLLESANGWRSAALFGPAASRFGTTKSWKNVLAYGKTLVCNLFWGKRLQFALARVLGAVGSCKFHEPGCVAERAQLLEH